MSTVVTTTILPRDGWNTLNIGAAGDTVAIGGDSLNLNVLQDAGGNNIFTSSSGTITSTSLGGGMTLLSTQTASSSASVSFTTQLTSTYDVYVFKFIDINPSANATFGFNGSTDGGSNYNADKTTTVFGCYHAENDSAGGFGYNASRDLAGSTSYQNLCGNLSNTADGNLGGELYLFAPSSTTYVKHFYARTSWMELSGIYYADDFLVGGYLNTTSAINAVQFNITSGTFDGTIKLYGISKT